MMVSSMPSDMNVCAAARPTRPPPMMIAFESVVKCSNNDVPAFIVETAGLIDIFNYEDIRKFGFVSSVNEILLNGSECSENEMP